MFTEWHRLISLFAEWRGASATVEFEWKMIDTTVIAVLRGEVGEHATTGHLDAWGDGREQMTVPVGSATLTIDSGLLEGWELDEGADVLVVDMLDHLRVTVRPILARSGRDAGA